MTDFLASFDLKLDLNIVLVLLSPVALVFTQISCINNIGAASEIYSGLNKFASKAFSSNQVEYSQSVILRDFMENIIQF